METKKYYGVKGDKEFPNYMNEFFQAWPEKFEERKNMVKPAFYGLLAVVCVFVVIFPQVIPLLPLWLIRVAGVIGASCSSASAPGWLRRTHIMWRAAVR